MRSSSSRTSVWNSWRSIWSLMGRLRPMRHRPVKWRRARTLRAGPGPAWRLVERRRAARAPLWPGTPTRLLTRRVYGPAGAVGRLRHFTRPRHAPWLRSTRPPGVRLVVTCPTFPHQRAAWSMILISGLCVTGDAIWTALGQAVLIDAVLSDSLRERWLAGLWTASIL